MSVAIHYEGKSVVLEAGETVLEGLEKAGLNVSSSCRAGACQCCMLKAVDGKVPAHAQQGLKPGLRDSGHFLACLCRPEQSLTCVPAHTADFRGYVTIQEVRPIGANVVLVRFTRPEGFNFNPGQFVTLTLQGRIKRSYSIASQSDLPYFDIHVRRVQNGQMSGWLHTEAQSGDTLWLEGAKGDCIYSCLSPDEPITLIGTGTGIAPLYAVLEDALRRGHSGPVTFYQGALSEHDLYFEDQIQSLIHGKNHVRYVRCVLQQPTKAELTVGDLKQIVAADLKDIKLQRIYLCGDPGLVRVLKKQCFLAGVSLNRIHSDPFIGTAS